MLRRTSNTYIYMSNIDKQILGLNPEEDYSKIDEMVGNQHTRPSAHPWQNDLTRMTPAKHEKKFETRTKISADPQDEVVGVIFDLLNAGDDAKAREVADNSQAPELLNEFIDEVIKNGGQEEGRWMFARDPLDCVL